MDNQVIIIGAGGHARVVASVLIESGAKVKGFYDDNENLIGSKIDDIPILGSIRDSIQERNNVKAIMGIGDNKIRKKLVNELNLNWTTAIHPFSYIDKNCKIGIGTVICAGAIIQPGAVVGSHVVMNTKASVDHDTFVGDYSHIAVAHLAGGASIDEGVFMALNSTVLPGLKVGSWTIVGAGALVTKNIDKNLVVIGSPARPIKSQRAVNEENTDYLAA